MLIGIIVGVMFLWSLMMTATTVHGGKVMKVQKQLIAAYKDALDSVEQDVRREANMRSSDPFLSGLLMDMGEARKALVELENKEVV
jgi:hypothetical protein